MASFTGEEVEVEGKEQYTLHLDLKFEIEK